MQNLVASFKRQVLKPVHIWIGIICGVVVLVVALTGSVIVFRTDFVRNSVPATSATASSAQRITLEDAALAALRFRQGSTISRVRFPTSAADPYTFQIESKGQRTERIAVDSSSGRVLGVIEPGWVDWMIDLHRNLLSGRQGRQAVGFVGILLFVLSTTGLLLWILGPRGWQAWISVRPQGSMRRFYYELHSASGLWAYAFFAMISFTGIERAFPDTFRQAVKFLMNCPGTAKAPKSKGDAGPSLSLSGYLRIGAAAMPDGMPVELRLQGRGPVDLRLHRPGDLSPDGNHVYMNPGTGAAVMVDRIAERPLGDRFLASLAPLHYGQFGGAGIKIAWALFGLTPVLLFVTGLVVWWRPAKSSSARPTVRDADREDLALSGRL